MAKVAVMLTEAELVSFKVYCALRSQSMNGVLYELVMRAMDSQDLFDATHKQTSERLVQVTES